MVTQLRPTWVAAMKAFFGFRAGELALEFGVATHVISAIAKRQTWKHI